MITDKQLQDIGMRIRQKREALDLTQEKAAEILDISQTHYKNIEHGRTNMSPVSYTHLDVYKRQSLYLPLVQMVHMFLHLQKLFFNLHLQ